MVNQIFNKKFSLQLNQAQLTAGRAKYWGYDHNSLTNANMAVMNEGLSLNGASQRYGLPFLTNSDRITRKVDQKCCTMGSGPLLSLEEESALVINLKEKAAF